MGTAAVDFGRLRRVAYDRRFLACSGRWLSDSETRELTDTADFTAAQQEAWFAGLADRTNYLIWGVLYDNEPVGVFGLKNVTPAEGEFWGYIGEKTYWGRGIGQWLLQESVAEGRARGWQSIRLRVKDSNQRAVRAYEKFGFTPFENPADALLNMRLQLTDAPPA